MTDPIGVYGKLPMKADFIARAVPDDLLEAWDEWLQRSLEDRCEASGADYATVVESMPGWRFALCPGVAGSAAWVGAVVASRDRVGRRFPLAVFRPLDSGALAAVVVGEQGWFSAIEGLLQQAACGRGGGFDEWLEAVAGSVHLPLTAPATRSPRARSLERFEGTSHSAMLATQWLDDWSQSGAGSVWWRYEPHAVACTLLLCRGALPVELFAALCGSAVKPSPARFRPEPAVEDAALDPMALLGEPSAADITHPLALAQEAAKAAAPTPQAAALEVWPAAANHGAWQARISADPRLFAFAAKPPPAGWDSALGDELVSRLGRVRNALEACAVLEDGLAAHSGSGVAVAVSPLVLVLIKGRQAAIAGAVPWMVARLGAETVELAQGPTDSDEDGHAEVPTAELGDFSDLLGAAGGRQAAARPAIRSSIVALGPKEQLLVCVGMWQYPGWSAARDRVERELRAGTAATQLLGDQARGDECALWLVESVAALEGVAQHG